jgi:DNA-binding NtrC family response regulator
MSELRERLKTVTARRARSLVRRSMRLEVIEGPDAGSSHEFEERARAGARPLAELRLRDPKVSGFHFEVIAGDELRILDLGSKNGTYVAGVRVVEAILSPGQTIFVGDTRVRVVPATEVHEVLLHPEDDFHGILGSSSAIRALTARLEAVAASSATVLIRGETGSGKERVAKALHAASPRREGPFITVDCGAISPTLIEAELFGHERGAYTGADRASLGALERANGGTLFFDEIGDLPLELQPRLLRLLESKSSRRLGGEDLFTADVRFVAATNRDLALDVAAGRFREDLYYRLAVVVVSVPPLRARTDDVPILAAQILRELGADPEAVIDGSALDVLMRHSWPGNVRELRNTLARAVALMRPIEIGEERCEQAAGSPAMTRVDLTIPLKPGRQRAVEAYERGYLTQLLQECSGNISEVARRAGMDRMSIYRMIDRLQIAIPRGSDPKGA